MVEKILTKKKAEKINKILSSTFKLDKESCNIIIDCLRVAVKKRLNYFKFNLRNLYREIDTVYMCGYRHMEKHVSKNINEQWSLVDLNEAYSILGLCEKPTPKVLVMLLLEKLQRNEIK